MEPGTALTIMEAAETLLQGMKQNIPTEDKDKLRYLADLLTDLVAQNEQYT